MPGRIPDRPKLLGRHSLQQGDLTLELGSEHFVLEADDLDVASLERILVCCNGESTLSDIERESGVPEDFVTRILEDLDEGGFLEEALEATPECRTGASALLEIEDLTNRLLYQTVYQNVFWRNIQEEGSDIPRSVFIGLAIENYQFLFRESTFDSPALCFPAGTRARVLMNEFYCSELGHDELLVQALESQGISRENLLDSIPLPETLGLCNALAYWSSFDPLFFFATIGVLEGKDIQTDSYLQACQDAGLPAEFVGPIERHSKINLEGEHGNVARQIFREIPYVDPETLGRMKRQVGLFVEIYDEFFTGIWRHYSSEDPTLRLVHSPGVRL